MIFKRVLKTIKEHNLIEDGDKIILGLSGGPDSVCLFHLLHRLKKIYNIEFFAVHLNHMLRGKEADEDENYVKKLCETYGVKCYSKAVDVNAFCKKNKLGIEEGARKVRYDLFEEIKTLVGANKVAIAHNTNDQAETIIMRLMRGTGISGLRGIEYKRKDGMIRPILDIEKKDIEAYCEQYDLKPKIDKTNLESVYTRNKIRLKLFPYMEKEFNKNVIKNIVRMSENVKTDSDFIEKFADNCFKDVCVVYNEKVYIYLDKFTSLDLAIKSRIVIRAIEKVLGDIKSIDKKHIDKILKLLDEKKKGKKINLPRGLVAERSFDYIAVFLVDLSKINENTVDLNSNYEYYINIGKRLYINELKKEVSFEKISIDEFNNIECKENMQFIDYDKLCGKLILRNRISKDKIKLSGGTKKIKQLFISLKIPREKRYVTPVLEDENEIVLVLGHRISVNYKITQKTKWVLKIK